MVLEKLVNLDAGFEPTPAMSEAIREGLKSLSEQKTYSAAELRCATERMITVARS